MIDNIVIGAGLSGLIIAERIATQLNKKTLIIEKRDHIAGNCYDVKDKNGILIHKYGPHIFHTNDRNVWNYISQFTDWTLYQHKVSGYVDGKFVPIPFNLDSLYKLVPGKLAKILENKLINHFGYGNKVPVLELQKIQDDHLKYLADFIYEKIFLHYTEKQWGLKPEDIDPSVTARVPIIISRDDRYFQDEYQGIPKEGYTKLFEKLIHNKNIEILTKTGFNDIRDKLKYKKIFYTGPIDEFFNYQFGKLDYRYINIDFQTINAENYQTTAVVNYPNDYDYTRITEFKKFNMNKSKKTVIGIEYPGNSGFMAWPVLNERNHKIWQKYDKEAEKLKEKNIYFVGRLAEYKYYDMDDAVANSMKKFERIFLNQ